MWFEGKDGRKIARRRGVVDTHMLLDLCLVDHVAQGLGGVVELGGFVVVETKLDDVAHAATVEHGWGADVDVVEAVLALEKRRDRQDDILVPQDRSRDARERVADAEGGVAFAFDDVVGGVAGTHKHLVDLCVNIRVAGGFRLKQSGEGNTTDGAGGQHRQFGVAVLADDVGVHRRGSDVEVLAQVVAPARRIQHGACADDLI